MGEDKHRRPKRRRRYALALAGFWTLAIAGSLVWSLARHGETIREHARIQARIALERDTFWRDWNAGHGGVYVPVSKDTPPNPHLSDIPERDITTPSGRRLTLINPAYMTRQVYEAGERGDQIRGHLTSLNPKRPANVADLWETEALKAFELGQTEVASVEQMDGKPHMRVMRAFHVEPSCLKCHGDQGYKIGDVRGGISVSVGLEPFEAMASGQEAALWFGHGLLWLVVLAGVPVALHFVDKRGRGRRRADRETAVLLNDMQERLKELECLYAASRSANMRRTMEEIFKDILVSMPPGWRYPNLARGRITFDGAEYVAEPFAPTPWKLSSELLVAGAVRGSVELYYVDKCPELDEGPFTNEERNLIDGLAHMVSAAIERRLTEQTLKQARDELSEANRELEKAAGQANQTPEPAGSANKQTA